MKTREEILSEAMDIITQRYWAYTVPMFSEGVAMNTHVFAGSIQAKSYEDAAAKLLVEFKDKADISRMEIHELKDWQEVRDGKRYD